MAELLIQAEQASYPRLLGDGDKLFVQDFQLGMYLNKTRNGCEVRVWIVRIFWKLFPGEKIHRDLPTLDKVRESSVRQRWLWGSPLLKVFGLADNQVAIYFMCSQTTLHLFT